MQMKKRIVGLVLALCCAVFSVQAQETALQETDITQDAVYQRLCAFGVLSEDDGLKYEETVTRGAFVEYLMRIGGVDTAVLVPAGDTPVFPDVPVNHSHFAAIQAAYRLGWINGVGEAFEPDVPVTQAQVCKMLLGALGYGVIAENRGGYPIGYLVLAAETGLLRGSADSGDDSVTPQVLVQLLANALDTEPLEQTAVGDEITYETSRGTTLLNRNFDIYRVDGIVDSDPYTSLLGATRTGVGHITIDGVDYTDPDGQGQALLGTAVRAYYREEAGADQRELVFASLSDRNEITTVAPQDIMRERVSSTLFVYYDQERSGVQQETLPRSATLLYNGKQTAMDASLLCPQEGQVALIDSNADGSVDVVKVTSYRVLVVDGVSPSTGTVSDKLGGESLVLDPNDKNSDVTVEIDGKRAAVSQLAEWNVVFYAESSGDGRGKKVLIASTASAEGTVEAVSEDIITVGGVEYQCSESLTVLPETGMYATFYLDPEGKIAAKQSSKDIVYGYLNVLYKAEMGGVQARIFTENNRWVTLTFQGKVKYNGQSIPAAECWEKLGGTDAGTYRQLITYRVSDGALITEINTAVRVEEPWSEEEQQLIDDNVFRLSREIASARFRLSTQSFDGDISLGGDTKIFSIPRQQDGVEAEEKDYSIVSSSSFGRDKTYTNIYAYDADELGKAKACVIVGKATEVDNSEKLSSVMVVQSVGEAVNDEGEHVYVIRGMYSQYDMKVYTRDKEVLDEIGGLQEGDVVQFAYNEQGYVVKVDVIYRAADGAQQQLLKNALYAPDTFVAGRVHRVDVGQGRIVIEYGAGAVVVLSLGKVSSVYQYDAAQAQDKTTIVSVNDVQAGDWILASARYFEIAEIVLFR